MTETPTPEQNIAQEAAEALKQAQKSDEKVTPDAAEELKTLAAERDAWKDKALRVAADFENFKKRTEIDIQNTKSNSIKNFALDLLNTADNLSRAQEALLSVAESDATKPLKDGVAMVTSQLEQALTKNGIAKVEAMGKQANPEQHQVMQQLPSDKPSNEIIQELQAGYTLNARLLRPALVMVSTGQAPEQTQPTE